MLFDNPDPPPIEPTPRAITQSVPAAPPNITEDAPKEVVFKTGPGLRTSLLTTWILRKVRGKQDELIFAPHPEGLEKMSAPSDYKELQPYGVTERTLVTGGKPDSPDATITLWEKKADPGKPHMIYFSGRKGHVADNGPNISNIEGYDRYAGLKFLEELAKNGVGFTAVTMRGYGNNEGTPSEKGFRKDIQVLLDDWMKQGDHPPADKLIVAGYSLGTASAAITASEFTKRGESPALVVLGNPFSNMTRRSKEFVEDHLSKQANPKLRGITISENEIRGILKHPFDTEERLFELMPETHILIAYSSNDELINNSHSKRLESALKTTHPVMTSCFEGCGHGNVPPEEFARRCLAAYEKAQGPEGQLEKHVMRMTQTRDGEFRPQRITAVNGSWSEIASRGTNGQGAHR